MLITKIRTIKTEKCNCIKAFKSRRYPQYAWSCHHEILVEPLLESWQNRVDYIFNHKLEGEQAVRFRNFRPVRVELPIEIRYAAKNYSVIYADAAKLSELYEKGYDYYGHEKQTKIRAKRDKADKLTNKALDRLDRLVKKHYKVLKALHDRDWPDNSWRDKTEDLGVLGTIF